MESSMLKKAAKYLRESGKNKRWRKVLTVLGAAVVFVTAYVLLMPAVAIERKTVCELEEHTHTEECQGQILACGKVGAGDETEDAVTLEFACVFPEELHTHTEECYDSEDQLLCGYADYAVHTHDSSCYERALWCVPFLKWRSMSIQRPAIRSMTAALSAARRSPRPTPIRMPAIRSIRSLPVRRQRKRATLTRRIAI